MDYMEQSHKEEMKKLSAKVVNELKHRKELNELITQLTKSNEDKTQDLIAETEISKHTEMKLNEARLEIKRLKEDCVSLVQNSDLLKKQVKNLEDEVVITK